MNFLKNLLANLAGMIVVSLIVGAVLAIGWLLVTLNSGPLWAWVIIVVGVAVVMAIRDTKRGRMPW